MKFLFALAFSALLSTNLYAQDNTAVQTEVQHWECGTDCTATLYENGLLKITAASDNVVINDYNAPKVGPDRGRLTTAPWADYIDSISSIEIADGITSIGYGAFTGLSNVQNVKISDTVTSVGFLAFADERNLQNVELGNSVSTLGGYAFSMTGLSSINLPDSLERISEYALWGTNAQIYEIPDSVTYIGQGVFLGPLNNNAKVYCNNINGRCDALFFGTTNTQLPKSKLVKYTKEGHTYVLDGQKFRTLADMEKNNAIKRIYTIDEANKAAGKKNKVMIRYR